MSETAPDGGPEQPASSALPTPQMTTDAATTQPVLTAAVTTTPISTTPVPRPTTTATQSSAVPSTSVAATATNVPTTMPSTAPAASWVPVEDPPSGLMNCAVKNTAQASGCSLDLRCDDVTISSYACEDNGDGTSRCWCYNYETTWRGDYNVLGASPAVACAAGLPLCVTESDLIFEDPVCTQDSYVGESYCSDSQTCTRSAFVEGEVEIQLIDQVESSCEETPEGFYCSCSGYYRDEAISVANATSEVACERTAAVCRDDLTASGATVCLARSSYDSSDQCSRDWQCGTPLDLATQDPADADAAQFLLDSSHRSVGCSPGPNGASYCGCSDPSGYQQGTIELSDPSLSAACDSAQALALCDDSEFLPEGEITCDVAINASEYGCNAYASCTQPGRLGDLMIGKTAGIDMICDGYSPGDWTCECASRYMSFISEPFTISDDRGLETCDDAFERCRALAVYTEENGEVAFRFDPLPAGIADAGAP